MVVYREEKKETLTLLKEQLHVMLGSSTSKLEPLSITCNQTQQNFTDDIFLCVILWNDDVVFTDNSLPILADC